MRELKIYHPNAEGTGSCLKLTQAADGDIMFQIFPQKAPMGAFPDFDWSNPVEFVADWRNFSGMLMVFHGWCESLEDGSGVSYAHDSGWSKLMLRHVIEPVFGYAVEICERCNDVESRGTFLLSPAEALGLSYIFEGILNHTLIGGEP